MAIQTVGQTTHFIVQYNDAFGAPALAVANAVLAICEVDLLKLSLYMPYHRGLAGDPFIQRKIAVNIDNNVLGGPGFSSADNNGFSPGRQSLIRINPFSAPGVAITTDYAGFVFVAEMSEILMTFYGWDASSSQGEALSRVTAEELHPASTSNFVNTWLGWPRPRPDWISRNELSISSTTTRGDLDPIAYGCGMIFIYFLRYQIGISYFDICTGGGAMLSDRYRTLSGASDDPATRVGTLLDNHFGTGKVNIVANNPFPLYEGVARRVLLAFSKPTFMNHRLPDAGTAHVKPFFTCPAADYPYIEIGSSVTRVIQATTVGIGIPTFNWRINGQPLFLPSESDFTVNSPVDVPDPQNPGQPKRQTKVFAFDYKITNTFTAAGGSSSLSITSRSFDGDYLLEIRVDADETAVPTGPVSANQGITMSTRTVVYGGTYDADQQRCEQAFEKVIAQKLPTLQDGLSRLHNLPDPPPPGYLATILDAAAHIHEQLAELAATDPATASKIAHYAAARVSVPAHVFLKGARGSGPGTSA